MSYKPEINPFTGKLQLVPTQSDADITSAVEKKHDQNTDQYLDYGGANQINANEIIKKSISAMSYYINPDTGDNNNDGSSGSPFRTIQKAIDTIPKCINTKMCQIYLQSSQNYNEKVVIQGMFGGNIRIRSVSGVPADVLVTGISNSHVFDILSCTARITITDISIKLNTNNKNCIRVYQHSYAEIGNCLLGDNDNTGTIGIKCQEGSIVQVKDCADIDANKVAMGLECSGGIIQATNTVIGDLNYNATREGMIISEGFVLYKNDYEDVVSKKHTQNEDTNLIVPEGTIIDVEQLLFKTPDFYPVTTTPIAQTFVSLYDGEISKISGIAQAIGTPDAPMIIELRTVDGEGKPTDTVLGSSSVDYGDLVAPNDYTDFVLASPITGITKDTKYAIVLRTEATTGGYEFRFKETKVYTLGDWYDYFAPNWTLDDNLSLTFKVWIDITQANLIEEGHLRTDLFADDGIKIDGRDISEDGAKLDLLKEIPIYEQADEPVLTVDGSSAFWYDTDDNYRCYLIHRRGDKGSGIAEQIKTELI